MDIVALLIIIVVGIAFLATLIYHIISFLKGRIKIKLTNKKKFYSGETIEGEVFLKAKREIESNELRISLIALRRQTSRGSSVQYSSSSSNYIEIFRTSSQLEAAATYPPGHQKSYKFSFKVPSRAEIEGGTNGTLKAIVNIARMFSRAGRVKWKLEALVDAEGVDLKTRKRVKIFLADTTQNTMGTTENNLSNLDLQNEFKQDIYDEKTKNYILQYKDQYSREDLKKALINAGVSENEVTKHLNKFY